MRTYKLTIGGLSQKQVFEIIDSLPRKGTAPVVEAEDTRRVITEVASRKSSVRDTDVVSLTGKKAKKGSIRAKVLETLERMEKKHGVGTVTRAQLRDEVVRRDGDAQILYQLVRDGYIEGGGK